ECPIDCPGVCGCDGVFYCNECLANVAGVGVDPQAQCAPTTYQAHVLPTDAPRLVVFRKDGETCTSVMAVGFGGPGPYAVNVTPDWQIQSIVITNTPEDCALDANGFPVMPAKDSADASAAQGKLDLGPATLPFVVTADMVLTFPPGKPWVP